MKFLCHHCRLLLDAEPEPREDKPKKWKANMGYWERLLWLTDQWNYSITCPFCGNAWRFTKCL